MPGKLFNRNKAWDNVNATYTVYVVCRYIIIPYNDIYKQSLNFFWVENDYIVVRVIQI